MTPRAPKPPRVVWLATGPHDCVHCGRPVDEHAVMYACRAYFARAEDNARAAGAAGERARIVALVEAMPCACSVGTRHADGTEEPADELISRGLLLEKLRGGGSHG